jgi:hypothetical protein
VLFRSDDLIRLNELKTKIDIDKKKAQQVEILEQQFAQIQENQKNIEKLYIVIKQTNNTLKANNKDKIFYPYYDVYVSAWNNGNLKNSDSYQDKFLKIQTKVIELAGKETKDFEKLLKKAKTVEDKEQIFLN